MNIINLTSKLSNEKYKECNVTCNKILDIPYLIIKNNNGKIIDAIDLRKEDYLSICEEECNRKVTPAEVIKDKDCGFCDVSYILLGEDDCMPNQRFELWKCNDHKNGVKDTQENAYYLDEEVVDLVNMIYHEKEYWKLLALREQKLNGNHGLEKIPECPYFKPKDKHLKWKTY